MTLLVPGDPVPHRHTLPDVPMGKTERRYGLDIKTPLINAVANCSGCDKLFVTREDPDGYEGVRWIPLHWWHRTARRKLALRMGNP